VRDVPEKPARGRELPLLADSPTWGAGRTDRLPAVREGSRARRMAAKRRPASPRERDRASRIRTTS